MEEQELKNKNPRSRPDLQRKNMKQNEKCIGRTQIVDGAKGWPPPPLPLYVYILEINVWI
jgi:hypothetical protein